jgi:HK97 family phage major capsid protein
MTTTDPLDASFDMLARQDQAEADITALRSDVDEVKSRLDKVARAASRPAMGAGTTSDTTEVKSFVDGYLRRGRETEIKSINGVSPADGGFAVPPEWRSEIMGMVMGENSLLDRTDQQRVTGNGITYPVDESTAWQSTGGIQTYWDSEAATVTQSKPQLKDLTLKLHRLTALVPVTEELLEDAPAMASYVTRKAGEKMAFKVNDAIINGTGVGQPLGILRAGCLVTQAAEGSQVADTVHALNVQKMVARMLSSSFGKAVWLINQDVWPEIMRMGNVVTNAAGTVAGGAGALWMPPNGMANSGPYGSLLGRPIIVTEACSAIGDVGDIILADLTGYLSAVKGAIKSDISIHLWFDQNTTAFRFVMRMNGQPWLSAAVARKNGSNTLSTFVTLAAR